MAEHTNLLSRETSPYLLQHAHNPVNWRPWGEQAFEAAKQGNKLVLVSIGYSTCHWCHVMERESFEDEEVARVMNEHFVCIKVDREERPDIDQVYMTAVQLMTGHGGWPLNCFTLPDGRPVYGGTYFHKEQWLHVLQQLQHTWEKEPGKVAGYAERLHDGIVQTELVEMNTAAQEFTRKDVQRLASGLEKHFDTTWGGPDHAPKFPMPCNYSFLLRYAATTGNKRIAQQVRLTLDKMAHGGIFDQIGGGFARYSTDVQWKVPHFEKMLYDNAQLISLYSKAYRHFGDEEEYRGTVQRTLAWARREMRSPEGGWYSALDADTEGQEGLFYLWNEDQVVEHAGSDADFALAYYNVNGAGYWENGESILLRTRPDKEMAKELGLDLGELKAKREAVDTKLLAAREKRVRPSLDDKVLTSWNAMMVTALCDAHDAFGDTENLHQAEETMRLLLGTCRRNDGGLWHSYTKGTAAVNGYLEDYSFTLEALATLYQCTFNEEWLEHAKALSDYTIEHFLDRSSGMFMFTSKIDPPLIARKMEVADNVIPSSNSSMAKALFILGHLLGNDEYLAISRQQLHNVMPLIADYPGGYANWGLLLMDHAYPWYEVAITGPKAMELRRQFGDHYIPGRLFTGTSGTSTLPLLEDKPSTGEPTIHVCENNVCGLPVATVEEAMVQMR